MSAPDTVAVPVDEVERVLAMLEEVHDLLHQPLRYRDPEQVDGFARAHYQELKELYYRVVPGWLPDEVRRRLDER